MKLGLAILLIVAMFLSGALFVLTIIWFDTKELGTIGLLMSFFQGGMIATFGSALMLVIKSIVDEPVKPKRKPPKKSTAKIQE